MYNIILSCLVAVASCPWLTYCSLFSVVVVVVFLSFFLQQSHWTQLIMRTPEGSPRRPLSDGISGVSTISDQETKRREALWELFHSEVVYLTDHLLVLKEVRFVVNGKSLNSFV